MKCSSRNYGIDCLRIFAMLGVVVLHILGHGGILNSTSSASGFCVSWLLEIFAFPAVNCFVLISGYVGYREDKYFPRLKNIILLFFTVLFYSMLITAIFKFVYPQDINLKVMIKSCFPILTRQYWFFTAYFAMFLVSPMLNCFVDKAHTKLLFITVLVVLVFFTIPTVITDPFLMNGGYSFVWFVCVYLLGAITKKLEIPKRISTTYMLGIVTILLFITWGVKTAGYFLEAKFITTFFVKMGNMMVSYCSPTILLAAVGLLCLFTSLKLPRISENTVKRFSAVAFAVYLIHDNHFVREYVMTDRFLFVGNFSPIGIIISVIGIAIGIFLLCALIDMIRIGIFKVLHIEYLSELIEKSVKRVIQILISKIGLN